ncbi:MAG: hypothetical protein KF843_14060 [Flavobacteriales bacterium]|nr:hypothetical protein [Flavobacteriales bacterium]
MAQQKASTRMNELIHSLQQAIGRLEEGKLSLNELEQCTEDARAIYERMVVLRHKARETAVGTGKKEAPTEPSVTPNLAKEPVVAEEERPAPIRLDTRPAEASHLQTSLIDAIAETENAGDKPSPSKSQKAVEPAKPKAEEPAKPKVEEPAKPKTEEPATPKPVKAKPATVKEPADRPLTVADKMEHAPVADLRKAIALSQKFWFVAELFGGDRKRYEEAIDAINGMGSLEEAQSYMTTEITAKQAKPPGDEVAATFSDLLQRRFS